LLGASRVIGCAVRGPICGGTADLRIAAPGGAPSGLRLSGGAFLPPLRGGEQRGSLPPSEASPRRSDSQGQMGLVVRSPRLAVPACYQGRVRFASTHPCTERGSDYSSKPPVSRDRTLRSGPPDPNRLPLDSEDDGVTLAAAATQCGTADAATAGPEGVDEGYDDAGTGGAQWVAQCDGTAVDVDLVPR